VIPPAPNGPIYTFLCLYVPKETPPSTLYAGEGTWKSPAVTQVQEPDLPKKLASARLTRRVQPVDATPSNQLI
jgi:hypothetical protein